MLHCDSHYYHCRSVAQLVSSYVLIYAIMRCCVVCIVLLLANYTKYIIMFDNLITYLIYRFISQPITNQPHITSLTAVGLYITISYP